MSLPNPFTCDHNSKWIVEALAALRPHVSWAEHQIGDGRALLIELSASRAGHSIVVACTSEPWVEEVTGIATPVSLSALYALDVSLFLAENPSKVSAVLLIDRDNEDTRRGALSLAGRWTDSLDDGRIIVIAAGLTPRGTIIGSARAMTLVSGATHNFPGIDPTGELDSDVQDAVESGRHPVLIVDPWSADRGCWLTVSDFVTHIC